MRRKKERERERELKISDKRVWRSHDPFLIMRGYSLDYIKKVYSFIINFRYTDRIASFFFLHKPPLRSLIHAVALLLEIN